VTLKATAASGVLTLALARPEARNALSPDLVAALLDALSRAAADDAARVVVLAAEGSVFCAGGDAKDMAARKGDPLATKTRQERGFGALARALLTFPKPTVARVQGDALGAGLGLVLACDFAVVADHARLGATFAKMALAPDTGASWTLPRIVGLRAARELVLSAEPIDARRAFALGLASDVVPAADLDARVAALAGRLAEGPTRAYGLAKRALLSGAGSGLDEALALEATLQALAFTTRDQAEAVDAFLAKRTPRFEGR